MYLISNLFKQCIRNKVFIRNVSLLHEEILDVQTFCNVTVDVPFSVKIKPLNVHQYHNCDKLKIKTNKNALIKFIQDGSNITIYSEAKENDEDIVCSIKAPIKANINVTSQTHIYSGFFDGDKLKLFTEDGNITVEKFHGHKIKMVTTNGDINLKGPIQASDIEGVILNKGSITTERLQGLNLVLKAKNGNITTTSAYCNKSYFETENGDLILNNVHKSCIINLIKSGHINLGLDGDLNATIGSGIIDLNIARITGDCSVIMQDAGKMLLRVSEESQKITNFEIISKDIHLDENVKLETSESGDITRLKALHPTHKFHINARNSLIELQSASWKEMFQLRLKK